MGKYYISNNIHFIQGYGNLMETPNTATRYKHSDASQYLSIHPDHMMMRYGNAKKNRSYVISTNQKFLGKEAVVNEMGKAKCFEDPKDAFEYIDQNPGIQSMLGEIFVIDEKYKKVKRQSVFQPEQTVVDSPKETAKRTTFSPAIRHAVFTKSNVCAICGEPLDETNFTIDHIIPLSRGGTNSLDNLRAVHETCNTLKGNLMDNEMNSLITGICCNDLYHSPTSERSLQYIRAIVRGKINKYGRYNVEHSDK